MSSWRATPRLHNLLLLLKDGLEVQQKTEGLTAPLNRRFETRPFPL
jgi:hypothetical protein